MAVSIVATGGRVQTTYRLDIGAVQGVSTALDIEVGIQVLLLSTEDQPVRYSVDTTNVEGGAIVEYLVIPANNLLPYPVSSDGISRVTRVYVAPHTANSTPLGVGAQLVQN